MSVGGGTRSRVPGLAFVWLPVLIGLLLVALVGIPWWTLVRFADIQGALLPELAGVSALLLSVLLAAIAYLVYRASRETSGVRAAREALEIEVREREAAERRVLLLLNSTAEAIYGLDLNGDCTFANPACARILGYPGPEALLGRNMHDLIHHSHADGSPMPREDCSIYQAFRDGSSVHRDDEVLWRPDGTSFASEYWSYPQLEGGTVVGAVVTFLDIAARKQAEDRVRYLATHDQLTDLPNLGLAVDRLETSMALARRNGEHVAVMFVDLDGFKRVNDTLGHDAGDRVLVEVARRLAGAVRDSDTVSRAGGDEFLLVAPGVGGADGASRIAGAVVEALARPIMVDDSEVVVGASVGVSLYPDHSTDAEELIKLADAAMYRSKHAGKNAFTLAARAS